jgi:AAA+ ATPase superfamily predicted ATPase
MFIKKQINLLKERLKSDRKWVQILSGPRHVGKTTLIIQTLDSLGCPGFYASADMANGNIFSSYAEGTGGKSGRPFYPEMTVGSYFIKKMSVLL